MGKAGQTGLALLEMHPPCQRISLVSIPFVLLSSRKTTPREPFWTTVIARELIRERVRSGLQHAKSKGIRLGRPRLPDSSQQSRTTRWRRMRGSMEMHTTGSMHPGRGVNREPI
jgi:hypothetical protein